MSETPTTDAVKILHERYVKGDPERVASIKSEVDELASKGKTIGEALLEEHGRGEIRGYRQALRDVLEDVEEMSCLNYGWKLLDTDKLTAKIQARLKA